MKLIRAELALFRHSSLPAQIRYGDELQNASRTTDPISATRALHQAPRVSLGRTIPPSSRLEDDSLVEAEQCSLRSIQPVRVGDVIRLRDDRGVRRSGPDC